MKGHKKASNLSGSGDNGSLTKVPNKTLEPLQINLGKNPSGVINFSKGISKVAAKKGSVIEQAIQGSSTQNALDLITREKPDDLKASNALKLAFETNKGDNFEVIKSLVDKGVLSSGGKPFFPLHKSINQGLEKVASYLIEQKIELDTVSEQDYTALYQASKKQEGKTVLSLLKAGANPDLKINPKDETVLINMVRWEEDENLAVRILIANGANLQIRDKEHKSAIDYASQKGVQKKQYIKWLTIGGYVDKVCGGFELDSSLDVSIHEDQMRELFIARFAALKSKGLVKSELDLAQYDSKLPESIFQEISKLTSEEKKSKTKEEIQQEPEFEKEKLNMKSKVETVKGKLDKAKLAQNPKVEQEIMQQMVQIVAEGNDKIIGTEVVTNTDEATIIWGWKKSGKTVLANLFDGNKLKGTLDKESGEVLLELDNNTVLPINHGTSQTTTPNKKQTQIGTVIDMPGCNELTVEQELANTYFMQKVYSKYPKVKFVIAVDESMIKSGGGLNFLNLVKQFCSLFQDPSSIEKSVALVVTQTDQNKMVANIQTQIRKLIDSKVAMTPEVKNMLEAMTQNVQIFHKASPDSEIETQGHHLVTFVQSKEFTTITSDIVKFPLSEQAKMHGAELLTMAANSLELISKTLLDASLDPIHSSLCKPDNVFTSNYQQLKDWVPTGFAYTRAINVRDRYKDEYFLDIKRLMKLEKIGKELKDAKDLVSITETIEKLLNVFEEYVVVPNSREPKDFAQEQALKGQIRSLAYLTEQFISYIKLLPGLLGDKSIPQEKLEGLKSLLTESVSTFNEQVSSTLRTAIFELDVSSLATSDTKYFAEAVKILEHYEAEPILNQKKALCYKSIGDIWKQHKGYETALNNYYLAIKFDYKLVSVYEQVADILDSQDKPELALHFYKLIKNYLKLEACYNKLIFSQPDSYKLEESFGDDLVEMGLLHQACIHYNAAFSKAKDADVKLNMQQKFIVTLSHTALQNVVEKLQTQVDTGNLYEFGQLDVTSYASYIDEKAALGDVSLDI